MWDVQTAITEWHNRKYGAEPLSAVGNKLGEESGEVCRAIDRLIHGATSTVNLREEIADAAIVLIAICGRESLDFIEAIEDRAAEVMTR